VPLSTSSLSQNALCAAHDAATLCNEPKNDALRCLEHSEDIGDGRAVSAAALAHDASHWQAIVRAPQSQAAVPWQILHICAGSIVLKHPERCERTPLERPNKEDLILLNRLCWINHYQSAGLDPVICARLLTLGLLTSNSDGHWHPTPAGRAVAVTSVHDGFKDWL
jgi:hypothetical protein